MRHCDMAAQCLPLKGSAGARERLVPKLPLSLSTQELETARAELSCYLGAINDPIVILLLLQVGKLRVVSTDPIQHL